MTACDMEKKLIALVINEEKLTDGPIQMVQKGFKRAIDNRMDDVVKQALEHRVIGKVYFGKLLRNSIIIHDMDVLMLLTKENPEKEYYHVYKRALQMAIEENSLEALQFLISCGLDIYSNREPLNLAIRQENIEIVRYLVRQGADINISFNSIVCKSLMDYFIKKKDGEMIKYLIERGFQFNGASRRYRIAVELVNSENMDYLEYLLEKVEPDNRGFKKDVLEYALCQEKAEVIQYIVKNMSSKEQRYCDHIIRNSIKNSINLGSYIDFLKGCGIDVSRIMSR